MIDERFNWRIPRSWNEVPTEQLEAISKLTLDYNLMIANNDRLAEPQFKLKALLLVSGLEDVVLTEYNAGTDWYYFPVSPSVLDEGKGRCARIKSRALRWLGRKLCTLEGDRYNHYVKVPAEVIHHLTSEHLKWLDDPYQRLKAPYDFIEVGGKKMQGPSDKMTSVTYQQYTTAQNLVTRYWQIQENLRWLLENNKSEESIVQQGKSLDQVRKMFLACLFCPGSITKEIVRDGKKIEVHRETYDYDPIQLEGWEQFDTALCDRVFPVMLQFYFSVQQYFSNIFPDLFVKRDDNDVKQQRPDFMLQEVETMAAIMKYQNFSDFQHIYDSNAVHILKVLDNMAHEAKEMKKYTSKH